MFVPAQIVSEIRLSRKSLSLKENVFGTVSIPIKLAQALKRAYLGILKTFYNFHVFYELPF